MELVVVNGGSNIAKSVIRGLAASGSYSSVRLLDIKPNRQSVYDLQRELATAGVQVDKRMTSSATELNVALEGAENLVYFTHDYVSMTGCKNNYLVATAKLAKKHGISNTIAVCPIEHDFAASEDSNKNFVVARQEAEQKAMDANPKMSLLTTDLVYGHQPSYLFHYMAQSANKGSIMGNFKSEKAKFKPVSQSQVTQAVAHALASPLHGHFGLYGQNEHSIAQLLEMVEGAVGKQAGAQNALLNGFTSLLDDFFVGTTHDGNLDDMMAHYAEAGCSEIHTLKSFCEASGLHMEESDIAAFFKSKSAVNEHMLSEPSNWKLASLD